MFVAANPDVPFNFDWGVEEFDAFWHEDLMPVDLKEPVDPCLWTQSERQAVDQYRDECVARYRAWCERD
jgi:hypothetical protein